MCLLFLNTSINSIIINKNVVIKEGDEIKCIHLELILVRNQEEY